MFNKNGIYSIHHINNNKRLNILNKTYYIRKKQSKNRIKR